jgi:hypothetical protein
MALQKWLEQLRKWIDEEEETEQQPVTPRSKWEDFLVALARDVEKTMLSEMFTPPGGPTYIPREYIVFLSAQDDAEWQGEKREGLEKGLHYVLTERAKELVGEREFQTRSIAVELKVDGALDTGQFRVQHVWDSDAQKTVVKPRREAKPAPPVEAEGDEATIVRPRKPAKPLFSMTVRRPSLDQPESLQEFFKELVTIGRGSRQIDVDLKLEGDPEVSRKHVTVNRTGDGSFTLTCHGANPVVLEGGREVSAGETIEIRSGDKLTLCSFELVIQ